MNGDRHGAGEDAREREALQLIRNIAELEDGTGHALVMLEEAIAGLDEDIRRRPAVRVAAEPLLAEMRLGLGEDAPVAETLEAATVDAFLGDDAARVVALRICRALVRVEAVELRDVVKRLHGGSGLDAVLSDGLDLTRAVLDAASPGAHPLAFTRLPGRFADRILPAGDQELLLLFLDVENAVHERIADDRRMARDLFDVIQADADNGGDTGNGTGKGAGTDTGCRGRAHPAGGHPAGGHPAGGHPAGGHPADGGARPDNG